MSSYKVVIVGGGPVGALAGLYAAQRGFQVEIYEMRDEYSQVQTATSFSAKSISLTLSERGIKALRHSQCRGLAERILSTTVPVYGRMVHSKSKTRLTTRRIAYDVHGQALYAISRSEINQNLLEELSAFPNVRIFYKHRLNGLDMKQKCATFQDISRPLEPSHETKFDLLIGADGAHSTTRFFLSRYAKININQKWEDIFWCELTIPAGHALPMDCLHMWPQRDFMLFACPDKEGTLTCNLFAPEKVFLELKSSGRIAEFFEKNFPGITPDLIPTDNLQKQFKSNLHHPMIDIRCSPYHYQDSCVLIGDAAHAMVPFYGQGMNTGFEDVRILFEDFLDQRRNFPSWKDNLSLSYAMQQKELPDTPQAIVEDYLEQYTKYRQPDVHIINELALQNYKELRQGVFKMSYHIRKHIEEFLSLHAPQLGWATQYRLVAFETMRYTDVLRQVRRQGMILSAVAWSCLVLFLLLCLFSLHL
ncbi:kynurenine 3-monooxygenase [Aspergillus piperis CBS 112811]|uniref:Kynurenine 3-monooxygenase n=1 Tax=Aspergillus piperis CBS 112811 TaxID=1448313 RepID=A0A8G1VTM6_9EURO|nr:kynurenine 3-monooxygenase [Aspergillus piperis CBS 112811]RAH61973.1 kynurenine 3-monooxygenase [Aspergillus piperis CBS 112811]